MKDLTEIHLDEAREDAALLRAEVARLRETLGRIAVMTEPLLARVKRRDEGILMWRQCVTLARKALDGGEP